MFLAKPEGTKSNGWGLGGCWGVSGIALWAFSGVFGCGGVKLGVVGACKAFRSPGPDDFFPKLPAPIYIYIYIYTSVNLCISMHRVKWSRVKSSRVKCHRAQLL